MNRLRRQRDAVDEHGVVAAVEIRAADGDRVIVIGDIETRRCHRGPIRTFQIVKRADHDAVDEHLECFRARDVAALGGQEAEFVAAIVERPLLADAACSLEEEDLSALRRDWIARGEAAAIGRNARSRH